MKRWTAGAVAFLMMGVSAASAQVFLRGQSEPLDAAVLRVGPEGVSVRVGDAPRTVGWDRIREVRGEHGAAAAAFAPRAEVLWRARTRIERGDFGGAEPLLESMTDWARAAPGPTAAVVFEGVLRCRLRRSSQAGAAWAWLDWVHARGGAVGGAADAAAGWIGGRIDGPAAIDAATGLVPALPPVFLKDSALDAAASGSEWDRFASTEPVTAQLANLYRAAARFESGLEPQLGAVSPNNDSVHLVADVVLARIGDEEQRRSAREGLESRLSVREIEPWMECWCRVAIGRSLLRESDADQRRRGVIQLLHAPARFVRISPQLASLALADAALALHQMGDVAGAWAVKSELLDRFARTPAASWSPLRDVRPPPDATPTPNNEPADPAASKGT